MTIENEKKHFECTSINQIHIHNTQKRIKQIIYTRNRVTNDQETHAMYKCEEATNICRYIMIKTIMILIKELKQ